MTARLELTFIGESMPEIYAAMRLELARVEGNHAPASTYVPPRQVDQVVAQIERACSGGHGAMRLIPAGTARSGPRVGQPYPAFLKCDTCGERQELAA